VPLESTKPMADILIIPLPELGHILPTLPLTRGLINQGHRVVYLTAPQFWQEIASVGGVNEPLIYQDASSPKLSGSAVWYRFASGDASGKRVPQLQHVVKSLMDRGTFTLVLCDRILEVKYKSGLADLIGRQRVVLFSSSLFDWDDSNCGEVGGPTIVFCPECFELPQFRIPRHQVFYVEPSLKPIDLESEGAEITRTSRPLIIAAFGTQSVRYGRLSACIEVIGKLARRRQDLQFVLAAGSSPSTGSLVQCGALPNLTVQEYLPQRRLLKFASAMITHGGLGSIKEAIFEGVPLIVIPMLRDQPFNAMRIRHHGLGEAIFPDRLSLLGLEEALLHVLAGTYSSQISGMQSRFIALERSRLSHLLINSHLASLESAAKSNS